MSKFKEFVITCVSILVIGMVASVLDGFIYEPMINYFVGSLSISKSTSIMLAHGITFCLACALATPLMYGVVMLCLWLYFCWLGSGFRRFIVTAIVEPINDYIVKRGSAIVKPINDWIDKRDTENILLPAVVIAIFLVMIFGLWAYAFKSKTFSMM